MRKENDDMDVLPAVLISLSIQNILKLFSYVFILITKNNVGKVVGRNLI